MRVPLIIALVVISIVLIISVLLQPSKANGLSGFVGGGVADTFFSKNKARTFEVKMARLTIFSAIVFAGLVIALNLVSK